MPTVLITGASRGIGQAAARHLASRGWDVLAGVRSERDGEALATDNARITPVVLDVTDPDHVAELDATLPARLDALVNNAGIAVGGALEALPIAELRRQLEVNVVGQVAVTQAALARLRDSHGRVVFISSISGLVTTPMLGAYSASKFAIEAIANALRLELRPWRIPVTLIQPGQIDTDIWRTAPEALDEAVAAMSPEHRELYGSHIAGMRRAIPRAQKMAAPVDRVSAAVERALTARRPKAHYPVGPGARPAVTMARLAPTAMLDRILSATSGVPRSI